jgi:hypothetical protein
MASGFHAGVGYGDLTAQAIKVLLSRGYGIANFNRNQLRKDSATAGDAPAGVQSVCVAPLAAPDSTFSVLVHLILLNASYSDPTAADRRSNVSYASECLARVANAHFVISGEGDPFCHESAPGIDERAVS